MARTYVAGIALLLWSSCSVNEKEDVQVNSREQDAYVLANNVWTTPKLDVCWEDSVGFDNDKEIVRQWIESTWSAESLLQFRGWGKACAGLTAAERDIRIRWVTGSTAWVEELGRALADYANGMNLLTGYDLQTSEMVAAHEFGHALSFSHEQNRPDTPSWCTDAPQGDNGNILWGNWDAASIMNYCNHTNSPLLSSTDIDAASRLYGAQFPISAVKSPGFAKNKDVFARKGYIFWGSGLITRSFNKPTNTWGAWQEIAGGLSGGPTAIAMANGRIDVFFRGLDGHLKHLSRISGTWGAVEDLGGAIRGQPVAVSRDGVSKWTVIARNDSNELYIWDYDGVNSPVLSQVPGSSFLGRPGAVAASDGSIYVAVHWVDHTLRWLRSTSPGSWTGLSFFSLGGGWPGGILGSPSLVEVNDGGTKPNIYVFVRGLDNYTYYSKYNAAAGVWANNFTYLGRPASGTVESSPVAISRATGLLDLFVRDGTGRIYSAYRPCATCAFSSWFALPNAGTSVLGTPMATGRGNHIEVYAMQDNYKMLFLEWWGGSGWTATANFTTDGIY